MLKKKGPILFNVPSWRYNRNETVQGRLIYSKQQGDTVYMHSLSGSYYKTIVTLYKKEAKHCGQWLKMIFLRIIFGTLWRCEFFNRTGWWIILHRQADIKHNTNARHRNVQQVSSGKSGSQKAQVSWKLHHHSETLHLHALVVKVLLLAGQL